MLPVRRVLLRPEGARFEMTTCDLHPAVSGGVLGK
jgi:hypothetical protein